MIILQNVSKSFKRRHGINQVFRDLNLTFEDGSKTAVMGVNYSGKSTLMNMITGVLRPDQGRVYRSGLISYPISALPVVNGGMTVRQNINFLCKVYGFATQPVQDFVESYTGLPHLMNEFVANLTVAERVQIIYTIGYAMPFDMYLIDGNYAGGPMPIRERTARLLQARLDTAGLVIATQSIPTVRIYCTRVIVLDGGMPHIYEDLEEGIQHFFRLYKALRDGTSAAPAVDTSLLMGPDL